MKTAFKFAMIACAASAVALFAVPSAEAARCGSVSAQGEGLTKELAQEMAKMNLEFAVATKGQKASGRVAMKCGAPGTLLLTACTAKQRACS